MSRTKKDLNFKATELRLGLPGSESPERFNLDDDSENEDRIKTEAVNNMVSRSKRCFPEDNNGSSNKWVLAENENSLSRGKKDDQKLKSSPVSGQDTVPHAASKAQVVGWPPIRSFRKNSMAASTTKSGEDKDCKVDTECLYVKVSMDGAPYLRKVDLKNYGSYVEFSSALEKMFSGFTAGQRSNHKAPSQDVLSKVRPTDELHQPEYVLTYEDKDGDWMLVGDVPWNMFMNSCRRLRIMKSSDAVGLASKELPRTGRA